MADWKKYSEPLVIERATREIWKSWRETCELNRNKENFNKESLPAFHDPFAGGGAIPFEAKRLGLETYASDLNPVAVLINKAMIEVPPLFQNRKPVSINNSETKREVNLPGFKKEWTGVDGLSADVEYYGDWIRKEAIKRIGNLYPKYLITNEVATGRNDLKDLVNKNVKVIAWIWARTVKSPNPAFNQIEVPLIKSFVLSSKKGKRAWLEPEIGRNSYNFSIKMSDFPDSAKNGTKLSRGAKFRCILSDTPIEPNYIKKEGQADRIGLKLIAVVGEGHRRRIYLPATNELERLAKSAEPNWKPRGAVPQKLTGGTCYGYGLDEWGKLFTPRQLVALNTLSDLIGEVRKLVISDAKAAGWPDDELGISNNGCGATAYGDAIATYLAFAVDRCADFNNTLTGWRPANEKIMGLFNRQAIPMVWDFGEANILEKVVGGFPAILKYQTQCIKKLSTSSNGYAYQAEISKQKISNMKIISTDPPYYDNISYGDLSDFFYVWLRRILRSVYPELFATMVVPKDEELVALAYRHGDKKTAENFFLSGMTRGIENLANRSHPAFPITIYYAFKQDANTASTGWETFLDAVIQSGFSITGTWPMRSEQSTRMVGMGTNALASSIVLVCRKRNNNANSISRREFQRELKNAMPEALVAMIGGSRGAPPIAPVDLAQAAIGPGMAIFSMYKSVLEADGSPMSVHDALIQINREIDDYFNAAEGDLDPDSRFCIDWFQQYGFKDGSFGEADVVARAKGTSVDAVADSGVIRSGGGKAQLLTFSDYPKQWNPDKDPKIPIWEATHQLIRALRDGGEQESGLLLSRLPGKTEQIRQLAYRLYTLCERQGWAEEARAYNELISSWHRIVSASEDIGVKGEQMDLF